jgi:hypothetical protein
MALITLRIRICRINHQTVVDVNTIKKNCGKIDQSSEIISKNSSNNHAKQKYPAAQSN